MLNDHKTSRHSNCAGKSNNDAQSNQAKLKRPTQTDDFSARFMDLADNDFIHADEAKHIAGLFIQKVQIKKFVRQSVGLVAHQCDLTT